MQNTENQLDFFQKEEISLIWNDLHSLQKSCRGLFARYNELERLILELQTKYEEKINNA